MKRHQRLILGRSLLSGAAGLLPLPYVDGLLAGRVRTTLLRQLAELRQVDIDAQAVAELALRERPKLLGAAGLGAVTLRGAHRLWRKVALSLVVLERADEALFTFQVATLFDHYCDTHHVGLGVARERGQKLRQAIDEAIRHARGRAVEESLRRSLGRVRRLFTWRGRRQAIEAVEQRLEGPLARYVEALTLAFDIAWAPYRPPALAAPARGRIP